MTEELSVSIPLRKTLHQPFPLTSPSVKKLKRDHKETRETENKTSLSSKTMEMLNKNGPRTPILRSLELSDSSMRMATAFGLTTQET